MTYKIGQKVQIIAGSSKYYGMIAKVTQIGPVELIVSLPYNLGTISVRYNEVKSLY